MSRAQWTLVGGAVLFLFAAFGMFATARSFDRANEIAHVDASKADVWSAGTGDRQDLRLGRHTLPSPGVLSVSVCPEPLADPGATLVTVDAAGHEIGTDALEADEGRGKRCFEASQKVDRAGDVTATLRVKNQAARASIKRVTVQASRRITPRAMWPVVAMLVSFLLLGAAPREREEAPEASAPPAPAPPAAPPLPFPASDGFLVGAGVVPPETLRPGEVPRGFDGPVDHNARRAQAERIWVADMGAEKPHRPLLESRWAPVVAMSVYLGVHLPLAFVAAGYLIAFGKDSLQSGAFVGLTTLVQHGLLALGAFWMLGGFGAHDVRKALGINPLRTVEVVEAVVLATLLVTGAIASTRFIKDAGSSPIGEMIEIVPVRYVIAFGALLAPLSEELFFRGVLVKAFSQWGRGAWAPWVGILGSALVFTSAHAMQLSGAWLGLVPIAAVGLVNGWLRVRSGGITQPWLVHTLYNAALSLGLYFGG